LFLSFPKFISRKVSDFSCFFVLFVCYFRNCTTLCWTRSLGSLWWSLLRYRLRYFSPQLKQHIMTIAKSTRSLVS
jgi:hypothetical protein